MTVLEIQKMNLRIPNHSPQQAQEIGQKVARALANGAESISADKQLGRLHLNIKAPQGQSPEQLAETIVQAILNRIEH